MEPLGDNGAGSSMVRVRRNVLTQSNQGPASIVLAGGLAEVSTLKSVCQSEAGLYTRVVEADGRTIQGSY